MLVTKTTILTYFAAQAAAMPLIARADAGNIVARGDIDKDFAYYIFKRDAETKKQSEVINVVEPEKAGDIDKDFAYYIFKRDEEAKKEAEVKGVNEPEKAGDIDKDFAYYIFKRSAEKKVSRAPWDAELDFANFEFKNRREEPKNKE
ncbi:hypothetical protein ColKHC_06378 [Colletotrichum higginsianum]|uniref:Uncharacterized protein n=1 Tax=Colletotrichum higginsianum TaxID=80884 RepID=A0A4T0VUI0_9PEZI|nr:hypothetical protein CH35J_008918 [Colletotrichum higginsianum]GJC97552.1 hypothetical protein ColKHC_06378 [Colletotrichum higginsianum]